VASSRDLENEFQKMATYFQDKETEHNWADREKSIIRLRSMLRGGVHDRYPDVFLSGLKHGMLELSYKTVSKP
jgi:CLIP-associating protein 1/2